MENRDDGHTLGLVVAEMKMLTGVEACRIHVDIGYLKDRAGDGINAVVAAACDNFNLLIRWIESLLRVLIAALLRAALMPQTSGTSFGGDSSQTTKEHLDS